MQNRKRWLYIFVFILCIGMCGCKAEKAVDSEVKEPEVSAKHSLLEVAQKLQANAYTNKTLTDTCYGLSDPGNVGVIEKNTDEVRYPIPSDEKFEGEVINWNDYSYDGDNLSKFKDILQEVAKKNQQGIKVKLNMPKNEVIDIDTTKGDSYADAIVQGGLDGFYLQGNGCTFNIQYEELDYRGFLLFKDGGDIHFQDFTVDYEVPTTVSGVIQSYDMENLSVTLAVSPECNELIKRLQENEGKIYNYIEYNRANRIPKDDGTYVINSSGALNTFKGYSIAGDSIKGYSMTIYFSESAESFIMANGVGDYGNVLFSGYNFNAMTFIGCGNLSFEGITIHSAPSMGIVGSNNENVYINRLNICLKEGRNQFITTCADGLHFEQNEGEVQITNSLIENCYDDALNLKAGYWYDFTSYDVLEQTITITKSTQTVEKPNVGDVMEIYDRESFERKGSLTVESVTGTLQCYVIKVKESLAGLDIENWTNCAVANNSSATLLFKNNIVQNKRNRGIIMMASGAEISNNTFQNIAHGAVFAWSVLDQYNESGMTGDCVFKNNKFINGNYENGSQVGDICIQSAATTYGPCGIIKNMQVENNFFAKSGAASVTIISVEGASIKNNLYYQANRVYEGTESVVLLYNADKVNMVGNYCYSPENANLNGVYYGGTTDVEKVVMKKNTGLKLDDGASASASNEKVEVPYLGTQTITIDGDMSDWTTGVDVKIVGASTEDQRSASESWYKDNFKVKMAKIAYNDKGIYFGFDLYDNELLFKNAEDFWYGDCVELFMTSSNEMQNADMRLYKNLHDTLQLVCVPAWDGGFILEEKRTSASIMEQQEKFEVKVVETDEGYCGEVFIPFEAVSGIKETIDNGQGIYINCVFADGERNSMRRIQLANVPHIVENNKVITGTSMSYSFTKGE